MICCPQNPLNSSSANHSMFNWHSFRGNSLNFSRIFLSHSRCVGTSDKAPKISRIRRTNDADVNELILKTELQQKPFLRDTYFSLLLPLRSTTMHTETYKCLASPFTTNYVSTHTYNNTYIRVKHTYRQNMHHTR